MERKGKLLFFLCATRERIILLFLLILFAFGGSWVEGGFSYVGRAEARTAECEL